MNPEETKDQATTKPIQKIKLKIDAFGGIQSSMPLDELNKYLQNLPPTSDALKFDIEQSND